MDIQHTIKEHPWGAVTVLAVGAVILYMLLSGGGGAAASEGTTTDSGMQTAELQAATTMASAQLAYKGQQDQLQSAENIAALTTNADLLKTYSANDTALKVAGISAGVQTREIDATTAMQMAQYQQLTDIASISAGVNLANIAASRDTELAQTSALTDANKYIAMLGASSTNQANALAAQTAQKLSDNQLAASKKSSGGFFGELLGGLLSIF